MPNYYADFTFGKERIRHKKIFKGDSHRAVAKEIRDRFPLVKIHAIAPCGRSLLCPVRRCV